MKKIYPRSPREIMDGWVHLPRFIDKIRLRQHDQLPADYHENFGKGFDGAWLKAAGLELAPFVATVQDSITDGQVCDWVHQHVKKTAAEKQAFNDFVLNRGRNDDAKQRLEMRKEQAGWANRKDIQAMVDFIDADEGRLPAS